VVHLPDNAPPVLRFSAGPRSIDMENWPKDWADMPDERLVTLLRQASPRDPTKAAPPGTPRRRYDDQASQS
jgi:hypothetical protein